PQKFGIGGDKFPARPRTLAECSGESLWDSSDNERANRPPAAHEHEATDIECVPTIGDHRYRLLLVVFLSYLSRLAISLLVGRGHGVNPEECHTNLPASILAR